MSGRSMLIAVLLGEALGYFGYIKPDMERKEIMRAAQGSTIPEVVVLASAEVGGVQVKTFYVKSTNMVCTVAPSTHVYQTPLACEEAKIGVHRAVVAIVDGKNKL